jgi:uncharacterized surface protein with fasciclin (FAS1) repeats
MRLLSMFMVGLLFSAACKKNEESADPMPGPATAPAPVEPAPAPAPAPAPTPPVAGGTIVDVARSAGSFKTLLAAVEAAGLAETLSGAGPFTVFAPTDEAFAKIPKADLDALLADKAALTAVLTYHVIPGKNLAKDVATMSKATTVNGKDVAIDTRSGVKVGDATVVKADVEASNGVIHVIDTVLMPPK